MMRNRWDAVGYGIHIRLPHGLSREDFAHILGTFPLVFPDDEAGAAKMDALLAEYDRWADKVSGWTRA